MERRHDREELREWEDSRECVEEREAGGGEIVLGREG
jgi:hypothetical protein